MSALLASVPVETWDAEIERRRLRRDAEAIRARCTTLAGFIREAWHVVEPAREYIHGWHIDVICAHLEAVTKGALLELGYSNRLLFNIPPGHMKSLIISVFWQAWEWGPCGMPANRFLSSSYKTDYIERDTRRTRDLIASEWFQALWPIPFKRKGETSFANYSTGGREGIVYPSLTGGRGDRVTIDDPHSTETAESEAQRARAIRITRESLTSRMNDPVKSAIVIIMQRLRADDVSGTILSLGLGYVHVMLPAEFEPERCCWTPVPNPDYPEPRRMRYLATKQRWLPDSWTSRSDKDQEFLDEFNKAPAQTVYRWVVRDDDGDVPSPPRVPLETIERDKLAMGTYAVAGQQQQRPTPREGGMLNRSMFKFIRPAEVPADAEYVRHWDLAATKKRPGNNPAWTVGLKLGRGRMDKRWYVRHVARDRLEAGGVAQLILDTAEQDVAEHGRNIEISLPQDPGQAGKAQVASFMGLLAAFRVHAEAESGDKMVRADPIMSQAEAGMISLVLNEDGSIPPWVEPFLAEMETVPAGFMDQLDALSGAYTRHITRPRPGVVKIGTIIGQY